MLYSLMSLSSCRFLEFSVSRSASIDSSLELSSFCSLVRLSISDLSLSLSEDAIFSLSIDYYISTILFLFSSSNYLLSLSYFPYSYLLWASNWSWYNWSTLSLMSSKSRSSVSLAIWCFCYFLFNSCSFYSVKSYSYSFNSLLLFFSILSSSACNYKSKDFL